MFYFNGKIILDVLDRNDHYHTITLIIYLKKPDLAALRDRQSKAILILKKIIIKRNLLELILNFKLK